MLCSAYLKSIILNIITNSLTNFMKHSSFWNVDRQLATWKHFLHNGNLRPFHCLHNTGPWPEKCQSSPNHLILFLQDMRMLWWYLPICASSAMWSFPFKLSDQAFFAILLFLVCNVHHKACWFYILIIFCGGNKLWSVWSVQFFPTSFHFISRVQIFFTTLCSQSFGM